MLAWSDETWLSEETGRTEISKYSVITLKCTALPRCLHESVSSLYAACWYTSPVLHKRILVRLNLMWIRKRDDTFMQRIPLWRRGRLDVNSADLISMSGWIGFPEAKAGFSHSAAEKTKAVALRRWFYQRRFSRRVCVQWVQGSRKDIFFLVESLLLEEHQVCPVCMHESKEMKGRLVWVDRLYGVV